MNRIGAGGSIACYCGADAERAASRRLLRMNSLTKCSIAMLNLDVFVNAL